MPLINNLNSIKYSNEKIHYTYKNIDFLTNIKKSNNFIILFHGIANKLIYPVFRGFDYNFNNSIVMSIADPLIKYYNNVQIGWYLDTKLYPDTTNIIIEIINHIKNICDIQNIIFVSNCSGALIAVKLASILNQYCLIANPHTILKADDINDYTHFSDLSIQNGYRMPLSSNDNYTKKIILHEILKQNKDTIDFNLLDSRNFFKQYGFPKFLICYTHQDDYTAEWILKINEYYKKYNNNNIEIILNDIKVPSPHHEPFKNNNLKNEINNLLNKM